MKDSGRNLMLTRAYGEVHTCPVEHLLGLQRVWGWCPRPQAKRPIHLHAGRLPRARTLGRSDTACHCFEDLQIWRKLWPRQQSRSQSGTHAAPPPPPKREPADANPGDPLPADCTRGVGTLRGGQSSAVQQPKQARVTQRSLARRQLHWESGSHPFCSF